ncbi:fasciculation and elongation protein zeta-2 isoform X2 [Astatotilapia calliptera]|uniref:Fasciculation and elongation protein zeta 2a n=2 Tax=Haplochromini TaxID=319058 RepID=A0A3P9CWW8_9CICH|nr:fasciculation and elongation protein zeta-2 isoform X3 [Maylandia zebra]XP_026041526.1 fasciculation and elongation protein zeta-2-like isoform X2 [Astatotilapia calliptera]
MAAPIAHFDDDWPNLGDPSMVSQEGLLPQKGRVAAAAASEAAPESLLFGGDDDDDLHDSSFSPRENAGFRSMEDLVNDFDEKLTTCFQNFDAKTESIAPVAVIAEDTLLEKDEIWNTLTANYGHVMPVDWKRSRTRSLHVPTINLEEKPRKADVALELSDDEELRDQLDMHSIIVSCIAEEPLFTAEQVIEEIEEMMQDSPDMEAEHNPSQSDLSMLSVDVQQPNSCPDYEERMKALSIAELNERLEETEMKIRRFSEELVQQLALRDELDFEKEVKNSFISALIDVQNRQKEYREALKKKKKLKGGAGTSQGLPEKTSYLTTVIPYEKKGHPPSIEDLQILTKILQAMRDDSDKVPSLLTDYILKVVCPT